MNIFHIWTYLYNSIIIDSSLISSINAREEVIFIFWITNMVTKPAGIKTKFILCICCFQSFFLFLFSVVQVLFPFFITCFSLRLSSVMYSSFYRSISILFVSSLSLLNTITTFRVLIFNCWQLHFAAKGISIFQIF